MVYFTGPVQYIFNHNLTIMSIEWGKKYLFSKEEIKFSVLDSRWFPIRAEKQTAAGRR